MAYETVSDRQAAQAPLRYPGRRCGVAGAKGRDMYYCCRSGVAEPGGCGAECGMSELVKYLTSISPDALAQRHGSPWRPNI